MSSQLDSDLPEDKPKSKVVLFVRGSPEAIKYLTKKFKIQEKLLNPKLRSVNLVTRCLQECVFRPGNDCVVIHVPAGVARCFGNNTLPVVLPTGKVEIFAPSSVPSFVDSIRGSQLTSTFRKCFQRLSTRIRNNNAYVLENLPVVSPIQPGTLDSGYVVYYHTPWDFFMVFDRILNYNRKSSRWRSSFKRESYDFRSTAELFRGITVLLSLYMRYALRENVKDPVDDQLFKPNDLVIVAVPRETGNPSLHFLGYRAVIQERLRAITPELQMIKVLKVYLLDTGEERLVSYKYVCHLPRPFIRFPPMAVPCALHGMSPIGPFWSTKAVTRMHQLISSSKLRFFAEFYSGAPEEADGKHNLQVPAKQPYFIELASVSGHPGDLTSSRQCINDTLCSEGLGLEWSLCPQRPKLRKPIKNKDGGVGEPLVDRNECLHYFHTTPDEVQQLSKETLKREYLRLFEMRSQFFRENTLCDMTNILSLKIRDPTGVICAPTNPFSPPEWIKLSPKPAQPQAPHSYSKDPKVRIVPSDDSISSDEMDTCMARFEALKQQK